MSRWWLLVLAGFLSTEAFAVVRFTNAVSVVLGEQARPPLAMVDVNNDGRLDLLAGRNVFLQGSNGALGGATVFSNDVPIINVVTGDFNADGNIDVLRFTNVWMGAGDGNFALHGSVPWALYDSPYDDLRVADGDKDGRLDLVTCHEGVMQVWLGNGAGGFARAAGSNYLEQAWGKLDTGDFNRDGVLDVAFYRGEYSQTNTVLVLTGKGDGTFTNVTGYARPGYDRAYLRVADLNLDDVPDVVVAGEYIAEAQVFLGESNGLANAQSSGFNSGSPIQLADVNGDGYLDQLRINFQGLLVGLGRGDGTFTNQPVMTLPGTNFPSGNFAVGDYNGDLKTDIVVRDGNTLIVLTNCSDMAESAPRLAFHSRGPDVLRWPVASNGFFGLEFRSSLNSNFQWTAVSGVPVQRGTNFFATNAPITLRGYYRLRRF